MSSISRKQLEIRHSLTYQYREALKQKGCEWDGIARAWIAPDLKVLEECYKFLEAAETADNGVRSRYYGQCGWNEIDLDEWDKPHGEELKPYSSIKHTPTKTEAIKICGEENVKRYWRDEIPQEVTAILLSGDTNWNQIYERLENSGWKARSVSLMRDVVDHFRNCPPDKAEDEILSNANDAVLAPDKNVVFKQTAKEVDGVISAITDGSGEIVSLAVSFPYDAIKVNMVKWIDGRRWDAAKKRWVVPIEKVEELLKTFPDFRRSAKVAEIEEGLKQ